MKLSSIFDSLYKDAKPRPLWKGIFEALILIICVVLILKVFGFKGPPSETGVWPYVIFGIVISNWPPKWRFIR